MGWLRRFRAFTGEPPGVRGSDVVRFLSHLAEHDRVAASTQNQAFSALLFLFRHVLCEDLDVAATVRAPERRRLPVVLSQQEVGAILERLEHPYGLMARVVYGCGLRLQECLELRVKDVELDAGLVVVRSGKGDKDRRTVLPESVRGALAAHLESIRCLHEADRADGAPGVACQMPWSASTRTRGRSGVGSGYFLPGTSRWIPAPALSVDTISIRVRSRNGSSKPSATRASPKPRRSIHCGIASPRTCWRLEQTSGPFRNCSGTRTCRPRWSTRTSPSGIDSAWRRPWMPCASRRAGQRRGGIESDRGSRDDVSRWVDRRRTSMAPSSDHHGGPYGRRKQVLPPGFEPGSQE